MKKISSIVLAISLMLLSACGAAKQADTTADEYRAEAVENITETLSNSTDYSDYSPVIYEYTVISSYQTKASYYMTPAESETKLYSSINSYESESTYEITDEEESIGAAISGEEAWYLEFMIAYTVNEADAAAGNRFKDSELESIYNRSTVKADRDFTFNVLKFDYMTSITDINNIAIKKNGKVFTLYLNGDPVKTLALTKDIKKAYLLSYKHYIARIDEIVD